MNRRKRWIRILVVLVLFFAGCQGIAGMDYFCSECATDQNEIQFCLPVNRPVLTLYLWRKPTEFTSLVRAAHPEPCEHRWVFASSRGGLFVQSNGADARRRLLKEMEKAAIVTSASRVDPSGAVDFIRWTLRTDVPQELGREMCFGADGRAVDFDSSTSFQSWFDEFRKKAGGRAQT